MAASLILVSSSLPVRFAVFALSYFGEGHLSSALRLHLRVGECMACVGIMQEEGVEGCFLPLIND
jgi:hypothetical protein